MSGTGFDEFEVEEGNVLNLPLPAGGQYQSGSLDMNGVVYTITKDGKLRLSDEDIRRGFAYLSYGKAAQINAGVFSGAVHMHGDRASDNWWREYGMVVVNNQIVYVVDYGDVLYIDVPDKRDIYQEQLDSQPY